MKRFFWQSPPPEIETETSPQTPAPLLELPEDKPINTEQSGSTKLLKELQSLLDEPSSLESMSASGQQATPERNHDRSLYKAVLASLYDAVIIVDQKGYIIACNSRAEQFFNYTEAEFWNMPCAGLITGFNSLVLNKIRGHVANGRFTVLKANCRRKDAGVFPGEIAISQIHYLNECDLLMSIRSLERRQKAEERRELELEAARSAGVGLMVVRRDGLIEYVNQAVLRILQLGNEHQVLQRFLGDFCESLSAATMMLRTPVSGGNWMGRANFKTSAGRSVSCAITAALCSARKDVTEHIVVTLLPDVKAL